MIYFVSVLLVGAFILSDFAIKISASVNQLGRTPFHPCGVYLQDIIPRREIIEPKPYALINLLGGILFCAYVIRCSPDLKFTTYLKMNRECQPSSGPYSHEIPLPRSSTVTNFWCMFSNNILCKCMFIYIHMCLYRRSTPRLKVLGFI